jgi:hypothetical protein
MRARGPWQQAWASCAKVHLQKHIDGTFWTNAVGTSNREYWQRIKSTVFPYQKNWKVWQLTWLNVYVRFSVSKGKRVCRCSFDLWNQVGRMLSVVFLRQWTLISHILLPLSQFLAVVFTSVKSDMKSINTSVSRCTPIYTLWTRFIWNWVHNFHWSSQHLYTMFRHQKNALWVDFITHT